jgi:Cu2+-exporting ATPase
MCNGVLLKSGDALEKLANIDAVVFDKTGKLTLGKPALQSGNFVENDL